MNYGVLVQGELTIIGQDGKEKTVLSQKDQPLAVQLSLRISAKKCLFDGDAECAAIYMDVAAEVAQDGHSYVITFLAEYAAIDGMRTIDDEL